MAGIQLFGMASGMDTESIIKNLMKAEQTKIDVVDKRKMKLETKQEAWKELNTKIYSFYTKQVASLKSSTTYKTKSVSSSDETKITATAAASAASGVHTVSVSQLAKGAHLYSNTISDSTVVASEAMSFTLSDGETSATVNLAQNATIEDTVNAINDAGLNIKASYDSTNNRIFINNTEQGESSDIGFSGLDTAAESEFFQSLGFYVNSESVKASDATFKSNGTTTLSMTDYNALTTEEQATYTTDVNLGETGKNSKYTYDGISFEGASNALTINGLSMTLKNVTSSELTINITSNAQGVYDKVKEFVTAYNTLLDEMNTKLNADSNTYEPLTDEERAELDEATITKWDAMVKEAALRKDEKISSLTSSMRSITTMSSGVDTASLSSGFQYLSDLGIVTGTYSERGLLHIEGDEEDTIYSAKTNKLMEAIENSPDKVSELLSALGTQLYQDMSNRMKSTSLNSALTFYNDKQLKTQISDYEDEMDTMEERMYDIQDRYTAQFAAMEQALANINSQAAAFTSMLGG